jgi:CBS-domain-containing membrane protein
VTVAEVASRELVTVEPEQNLDEALRLMAAHQVRRLPVVEDGRLVGMLAQADVAIEGKSQRSATRWRRSRSLPERAECRGDL